MSYASTAGASTFGRNLHACMVSKPKLSGCPIVQRSLAYSVPSVEVHQLLIGACKCGQILLSVLCSAPADAAQALDYSVHRCMVKCTCMVKLHMPPAPRRRACEPLRLEAARVVVYCSNSHVHPRTHRFFASRKKHAHTQALALLASSAAPLSFRTQTNASILIVLCL